MFKSHLGVCIVTNEKKSNSCIPYSSFHLFISALLGGDMLNQLIE